MVVTRIDFRKSKDRQERKAGYTQQIVWKNIKRAGFVVRPCVNNIKTGSGLVPDYEFRTVYYFII